MTDQLLSTSLIIGRRPCHEETLTCGRDAGDEFDTTHVSTENCRRRTAVDNDKMMMLPLHQTANANDNHIDYKNVRIRCCRRRRPTGWSSSAFTAVAVTAAVIATSISGSEAFSITPLPPLPLAVPSPNQYQQRQTSLNAVHKRSGNHDIASRNPASIAATQRQTRKRVTKRVSKSTTAAEATATPTMERSSTASVSSSSTSTSSSSPSTTKTIRRTTGTRKNNVFEQFTPGYLTSPFDVDFQTSIFTTTEKTNGATLKNGASATTTKTSAAVNKSRITNNNKINLRLRTLLKDDTGEQENEMYPDHSPEAAQQLADLKSYSKLSEEARRKANFAVKSVDEDDFIPVQKKTTRGVVARTRKGAGTKAELSLGKGEQQPEEAAAINAVTLTPTSNKIVASPRRRVRATVKETGSDSMSTYIKSLGQHELLHKEDEVLLGQQVRILVGLEVKRQELEEELLRPPTFAQWAEATDHTVPSLKQQIRRSQRAKAALIEANLRLVITVARQAVKKSPMSQSRSANSVQFQDACQQGIIGLTRATEKFDPELGFRFSTYAIWWIQKEVAKGVSEQSRSIRVPQSAMKKINEIRIAERLLMTELGHKPTDEELSERVGMSVEKLNFYRKSAAEVGSLDRKIDSRKGKGSAASGGDSGAGNTMDRFVQDTEHPSPSELIDQQMMKEDIRRLVRTLSPREQAVIRLRFGLDDGKPLGLADISAKFGVDKEKIKKIEARALLKLRQPNRSQVVQCYVSDHT